MNEAVSSHPKDLLERVKRCANLPSPPGVAVRVIELARDPEVDLGKLASVVVADPALVAKILRTANSSLHANHRKSENLRQALALLGLNATMSIALSFSLVSTPRAEQGGGIDYTLFWQRSLTAALCSRALGEHFQIPQKEELFLAGLLQDIGMLALAKAISGVYDGLIPERQARHHNVIEMEH